MDETAQLSAAQTQSWSDTPSLKRLKNKKVRGLSLKVSEKGALSIYGMGRFPVTLYKEQWIKLLAISEDIKKFIQENESRLKTKD